MANVAYPEYLSAPCRSRYAYVSQHGESLTGLMSVVVIWCSIVVVCPRLMLKSSLNSFSSTCSLVAHQSWEITLATNRPFRITPTLFHQPQPSSCHMGCSTTYFECCAVSDLAEVENSNSTRSPCLNSLRGASSHIRASTCIGLDTTLSLYTFSLVPSMSPCGCCGPWTAQP